MVQLTTLMGFLPLIVPALAAPDFKVNYYYDGDCTSYASTPQYSQQGSVRNWQSTNSNSANIANCDYSWCTCTFYTDLDGHGASQDTWFGTSSNCASKWGQGFKSFKCTWGDYTNQGGQKRDEGSIEGNL